MNPILAKQLAELGIDPSSPPDAAAWSALVEGISSHYAETERGRYLSERATRLAAEEMASLQSRLEWHGELRDSHYRNLFNESPIAIWEEDFSRAGSWLSWLRASGVADLDGYLEEHPDELRKLIGMIRIVDVNAAAVRLMRAPDKNALIGVMDADLYTRDEAVLRAFRAELNAVWDGSTRTSLEFAGTRWDDTPLYGLLNWSAPCIAGSRDLSRVAVAIVDITERREAEERLEDLIRSKDEFLASVSHELRTPLTTVYASAETLRERSDSIDDELRDELIGYIARESGELSDMVDDLLVAARAEIGLVAMAPKEVELRPIVDRVIDVAAADDSDRRFEVSVEGGAWVDPLRFKQIVRNLISNALRYGGKSIRVETSREGAEVVFSVLDNGSGVPRKHRETIFELYERGSQGDSSGVVGSVGVGLAVARQLARLMGGDLVYDYKQGWSRFTLTVPAGDPDSVFAKDSPTDAIVTYLSFDRDSA